MLKQIPTVAPKRTLNIVGREKRRKANRSGIMIHLWQEAASKWMHEKCAAENWRWKSIKVEKCTSSRGGINLRPVTSSFVQRLGRPLKYDSDISRWHCGVNIKTRHRASSTYFKERWKKQHVFFFTFTKTENGRSFQKKFLGGPNCAYVNTWTVNLYLSSQSSRIAKGCF